MPHVQTRSLNTRHNGTDEYVKLLFITFWWQPCLISISVQSQTPDAHVNRCLDGTEPQNLPEHAEPPLPNTIQSRGNPISSILGSIRSVITNLPLRPHHPSTLSTSTTAPKPPSKQFKPKANRPCPFYKRMPGMRHGIYYVSLV